MSEFDAVIGLEIHIQLNTQTKLFAPEAHTFGASPNQLVSPITMAHPGALPCINEGVIDKALALGLALNCKINSPTFFDRKNYFYPDLPKGYQISQDAVPICEGGAVKFPNTEGKIIEVPLERIHLEEDAGKSIHDLSPTHTMIDLNRAGTPLMELVTQPALHKAEDAAALFEEIRRLVRYLNVGEGDMEKGNLRCDANISVKPQGQEKLGIRVEVKNLNSFAFLTQAINHEIMRQIELIQSGGEVQRETRTWNVQLQKTQPMRDKELAHDYRYFPEPDLPIVVISPERIEAIKQQLPSLPYQRFQQYHLDWKLPYNESMTLAEDMVLGNYYETAIIYCQNPKGVANWLLGAVRSWINEHNQSLSTCPVSAQTLGEMVKAIDEEIISHHQAKNQIFPALLQSEGSLGELIQASQSDSTDQSSQLKIQIEAIISQHPDELKRYRGGQKKLKKFFIGQVMKTLKGKGDPKEVQKILNELL
ncbi:MAG: Asp-tRNA(Asn)/Glu-tRNA(Gln) amidotransferase subunit GatB [Bacteroidota bacterium]